MYESRRDYGGKRDFTKIELFVHNRYHSTTTWAKTLKEARHELAKSLGYDLCVISASFVRDTK